MIERQKKFSIGDKTFIVNFPNVGQLIDLESLKQALTNNRYGVMAASGVASMYYVLDIVDAVAFFQVCVPAVAKYYNVKNYTSLSPENVKNFVDAYQNQIKPWFDKTMLELKGVESHGGNEIENGIDSKE